MSIENRQQREERLKSDIESIKTDEHYESFGTKEAADIQQAIDIIGRLKLHLANTQVGRSDTGYKILADATRYLEGEMAKQVKPPKPETAVTEL